MTYCQTFLEGPVKDSLARFQAIRRSWGKSRRDFEMSDLKWDDFGTYYARDVFVRAFVVSAKEVGAAVRLPGRYKGWIPKRMIPTSLFSKLKRGDLIECRVLKWDDKRESFLLTCEEPA